MATPKKKTRSVSSSPSSKPKRSITKAKRSLVSHKKKNAISNNISKVFNSKAIQNFDSTFKQIETKFFPKEIVKVLEKIEKALNTLNKNMVRKFK